MSDNDRGVKPAKPKSDGPDWPGVAVVLIICLTIVAVCSIVHWAPR